MSSCRCKRRESPVSIRIRCSQGLWLLPISDRSSDLWVGVAVGLADGQSHHTHQFNILPVREGDSDKSYLEVIRAERTLGFKFNEGYGNPTEELTVMDSAGQGEERSRAPSIYDILDKQNLQWGHINICTVESILSSSSSFLLCRV